MIWSNTFLSQMFKQHELYNVVSDEEKNPKDLV